MIVFIYILFGVMGLCILGMIYCVIELARVQRVKEYREWLLDEIGTHIGEPTDKFDQRLATYNSVSFHEMVKKFWKSCDSFYPNKEFLQ